MKSIRIQPLLDPIEAEVIIPGSKSYTNRALIIAAMTKNRVRIINPLISDDTRAMIKCLRTLGIRINLLDDSIEVIGSIDNIKNKTHELDVNLSGTTIRFMLPFLAIAPGIKILKGREGLNKRPIKNLVDALRQLGATIDYLNVEGHPPLRITSSVLKGGVITINGGISSQYFSALLMVAPLIGKLIIEVEGVQISKPYIDMTIDSMKNFGVSVINEDYKKYTVPDQQTYKVAEYIVEGDFSSAGYFFAIAALTKSTLTLKNLNPDSVQADRKILDILKKMGSKITYGENEITIQGKGIKVTEINMIDFPDQAQTLAVIAAFADGITKLSGIQSLRVKETERITALENELKKMGIRTSSTADTLIIYGGNPKAARINTHEDHRMAMSFAVAGTKLSGIEINDPAVVTKTFPEFWEKLNSIGIKTKSVNTRNIVLIGMRGSGKTTVAKLLSRKLNKEYIELDELIVEKVGMSIPKIVKKFGWDYFRHQESDIAEKVSSYNDKIISTGGGIVSKSKNIETLKKNGILILLSGSVEVLFDRIGDDSNRPALTLSKTRKEEMSKLLKQRKNLYEEVADKIIDTNNLKPEDVVNQILLIMEGEGI